jgi:hypothetical protein
MRLLPILLAASLIVLAADQDTAKKPAGKAASVTTDGDRTKAADAWVAKFSKNSLPESAPRWYDIFSALEKKYGVGMVPCNTFDAARQRYFQEFIFPWP